MAEEKSQKLEREYTIPLRRRWILLPRYRRAGRTAKTIKEFIAKHMKVPERDRDKVKLDIYLNQELWARGRASPSSKIKVKAIKEGDIVKVELAEMPQVLKFRKIKHEKLHKKPEEKKKEEVKPAEQTKEEKKEDEAKKTDEKEKAKAVESEKIKEAKQEAKETKHVSAGKAPEIHRRAMNRH